MQCHSVISIRNSGQIAKLRAERPWGSEYRVFLPHQTGVCTLRPDWPGKSSSVKTYLNMYLHLFWSLSLAKGKAHIPKLFILLKSKYFTQCQVKLSCSLSLSLGSKTRERIPKFPMGNSHSLPATDSTVLGSRHSSRSTAQEAHIHMSVLSEKILTWGQEHADVSHIEINMFIQFTGPPV